MPADAESAPSGQTEKRNVSYKMPNWEVRDDIVISGISGRFPESDSVEELKKNLYEGIDMITENDRRWKPGLFGTPKRMGKLKEIRKFDALFFGVHGKQAEMMDPQQRLLLEVTYEAIFDAGYSPESLKGANIGVFVGCSEKSVSGGCFNEDLLTGYELLGMCTALMANRVSYTFDFKGPSITMDTACSSTMHAMNEAILAIRTNRCDAAIVGGGTISLSASQTISFARLGLISQEGTCKVFDASANGYVRSEAVGAIFLQKSSDARRCYATILHSKLNNDGAKPEGISFPSAKQQRQLFTEVYSELKMNPAEVDFVEAHGTGTVAGDREESNAIAEFFCQGRTTPLMVGSVKSNLGHAEAASGTCTMAKVVLSMEEGLIAPNLHYKQANPHVPSLTDGRMKVVSRPTPWKPGIVATNNFGFGGSNAHIVLRANRKEQSERKERKIPRLVLVSGRTEDSVRYIFGKVRDDRFTDEALVLLEEACKASTSGMRYRGFGLVRVPGEEFDTVIAKSPAEIRPVWFLFSGMGSQWSGMAKDMMKLDVFAKSIRMSAQVLKPHGVDLIHLLNEATEENLNHIIAPFVTIAAVQIALVDMVKALGIKPDGIVGHSVGELGCAYADGCFTAEQMLMAAFWRGNSCAKTKLIPGAMAAIGLSWEVTKMRCPEGVYPVCHNAEDSVTISGPAALVKKFVEELTADNVFARVVKTCDIAFHSKYVEPASHLMRMELKKVVPNPLPRSSRWVSSSVPEEKWNEPEAQLSSMDYHVNNLLSPVLFNEAMAKVPKNALIIEFAPHSLLQAIVKRILGPQSVYIGLMKRGHQDNLVHCLEGIGKMYTSCLTPSVKNLYEPVRFPVPRGTAMLNSLIRWDHDHDIPTWNFQENHEKKDNVFVDTFRGCPDEYLTGHKVDGRVLFPFMGYVWLAWKALARHLLSEMEDIPVVLEDISVFRASMLPKSGNFEFSVKFVDCDGNFRIVEGGSIVASGKIHRGEDEGVLRIKERNMDRSNILDLEESFTLDAKDFYKELRLRGYEYGPTFRGVLSADAEGLSGRVKWDGRWVSFMDAMMQIPILCVPMRALLLPTRVKSIRIDPRLKPQKSSEGIPFTFNPNIRVCRAGPVEIQGMHCGIAPKRRDHQSIPVLEKQEFVPLHDSRLLTSDQMDRVEEYSHVCSTLAHKILVRGGKTKGEISSVMNGFKDASPHVVDTYLRSEDKSYVILNVLKEIAELQASSPNRLPSNVKSVLASHASEIHNDLLTAVSLREEGLRSSLDVVQDNQFLAKMTVLEVSACTVFRRDVLRMLGMTTLGLVNFEYTVARLTADRVPEGVDAGSKVVNVGGDRPLPGDNDLVVAKDLFTDSGRCHLKTMQTLAVSLKVKGFVLLVERTNLSPAEKFLSILSELERKEQNEKDLEAAALQAGLTLIAKKKDTVTSVTYLFRKLPAEVDRPSVQVVKIRSDLDHSWVEELKCKMKQLDEKPENTVVWVCTDSATSGVVGLINCLRLEPGGKFLRYFFNASQSSDTSVPKFDVLNPFFKDVLRKDLLVNVVKNGQLGMFRHRLLNNVPTAVPRECSFLNVTKRGDLSSFKWIESPSSPLNVFKCPNPVLVYNYYAALNFRDVMLASGKLPPDSIPGDLALQECLLGLEFVGRESNGRRVMGLTVAQGMSTSVRVPKELLLDVPDHWTMEEASTVPVVYMTSYYALLIRGQMRKGESILIHSGTGGVGQAAIAIALSMGCRVFVTVGSQEKKKFLKEIFPELDERCISNSRDVQFEFDILNATNGEGVDLVLNSLAEEKLQASVRCLKLNGRFLEIGKYDLALDSPLGMSLFLKNITFHGILLDAMFGLQHVQELKQLLGLMWSGIKSGVVKPLKASVFGWGEAEEAFRFMASGKHVGKVVLKIRDEESDRLARPVSVTIPSVPRTYFSSDKSYVITGGLGGFGLELAGWLVERGAKKVVLSSRSRVKNEYQRLWIHRWTKAGVTVRVCNQDITTESGAQALLAKSNGLAPVGGIFHLAMVLHDGLFENLKSEHYAEVCQPKVEGMRHLDKWSRKLCPEVTSFVVFSSISGGRGNPGQSNYGYANSAMERMVERRKLDGLPGLAVQWGGIGDVGVVYEKMGGNEVVLKGTVPQRLGSCLEVLDRFMQEDNAVVSSFVPVEKAAFNTDQDQDVVVMLCKVLGVKDHTTVKPEMTLAELGMDSLMGVEIKQVLECEYDTVLSVPEVRQLTIAEVRVIGKKRVQGASRGERGRGPVGMALLVETVVPTEVVVPLNDVRGSHYVFFIHPAEGHVGMLRTLAAGIKRPVRGLQFTDKVPADSVQELSACYIRHVKEIQPHGPYHLVGYSYGAMVGFEMALQLQKTDQVKTLVCIDGSPAVIVELMQSFIPEKEKSEMSFTATPLKLFLKQYLTNVPKQLEDALMNLPSTDAVKKGLELLKHALGEELDDDLVSTILERLYAVAWMAKNYKPSGLFRGRATLIKSQDQEIPDELRVPRTEDYGLKEVVDGSLEVFTIKCSHRTITEDQSNEVSKIINDRI